MTYRKPLATPVGLSVSFSLLAILAVAARFWARRKTRMKLRFDDWFLLPALVLCVANSIIMLIAATNGNLGKYMPLRPNGFPVINPDLDTFEKCIYANKILSTLAVACSRHAILLFYSRIFLGRLFTFQVWALHLLNGIWGVVYTFLYIFSCNPISDNWTTVAGSKDRHCLPVSSNTAYAVSSVVIDVLMLSIPWPHVYRLKISRREKAAVLGIFGMGALVLAVAIGKCVGFFTVAGKIYKSHQVTHEVAITMYWTVPECCMAVICACLPTLRPLFRGWSPESVLGSVRSAISLHSTRLKAKSSFEKSSNISRNESRSASVRMDRESGDNEIPPVPKEWSDSEFITSATHTGPQTV